MKEKRGNKIIIFAAAVFLLDIFVWWNIFFERQLSSAELYFLDVGQGDSELIYLPSGIKVLIDGGPGNKAISEVDKIVSPFDRYIDLVILSHAQADHMDGLIEIIKRYRVGAFIWNGARGNAKSFGDLEKAIRENKIPAVVLGEGDTIKTGESQFDILWPSPEILGSKELNDSALVSVLQTNNFSALFTGDIGTKTEKILVSKYARPVDVLKVSHHGSKYSSSEEFLSSFKPKIAVIEAGRRNQYRHPTPETLARLESIGAKIFRTDLDGMVKIENNGTTMGIFKIK